MLLPYRTVIPLFILQGGGQGGHESEEDGEEDAGVDGTELATLVSVYKCDHVKPKVKDGKDGWECGWCGSFFSPRHATRALKHLLKIKMGVLLFARQ